ncbi:MAG: type II toxin-antitoxin system RatA family toxin [Methylophilaceae bacterium]|nr:type II toxin-antitoxin system RatA family toxin [Methylophilaceae bacterium]
MAQVEKTVLVGYSAEQMFALVEDVERYPEFLPWCDGTHVVRHGDSRTTATLHINYHHIKQSFTTENHKIYPSLMEIKLKDGPFKQLEGVWHFIALSDEACKIEFKLSYEFSNGILEKLIAPVFSHISNTMVDAFVERAEKIL